MRFVGVLGATLLGLGVGSAAVLAPVVMSPPSAATGGSAVAANPGDWIAALSASVRTVAQSALGGQGSGAQAPTVRADAVKAMKPVEISAASPRQDARTIDYLAHPEGKTSGKADARTVDTPWTTQVSVATEPAAGKRMTSSKPTSDEQRYALVRELQTELKRVGCYDGALNGVWNSASKEAMAEFTERVNASLPYDKPDFILLTLVQGHKGQACGEKCPSGQGLTGNGRCVPNSILAQSDRSRQGQGEKARPRDVAQGANAHNPPQVASSWTTTTTPAEPQRGSIGTPPAPVRVVRPAPVTPDVTAVAAAPEAVIRNPTVMPGRMSIGAPLPPPVPAPVEVARPVAIPSAPVQHSTSAKLAAAETTASDDADPAPVTAAIPASEAAQRRALPPVKNAVTAQPRPQPPVVVHRPSAAVSARPYVSPPKVSNASKSRRLVYEMFQRPDRN